MFLAQTDKLKDKMFTPSGCKDVGIYNYNDPFYFVYIIHPGKCLNKEFLGLWSFNPLESKTSRLLLFYRSIVLQIYNQISDVNGKISAIDILTLVSRSRDLKALARVVIP